MKRTLKDYWSANDDDVGIGLGSKKVCVEDVEADRDHNDDCCDQNVDKDNEINVEDVEADKRS